MFKPVPNWTQPQNEFLRWLYDNQPEMYKKAWEIVRQKNPGLGSWGETFASVGKALVGLAPAILQMRQQRDLMKAQLKQAQAGQPPIDTTQYMVPVGPAQQPQVIAVPTAQQPPAGAVVVPQGAKQNLPLIIGLGIAGLAAVLLLTGRRK